jgi:hypothetical protein
MAVEGCRFGRAEEQRAVLSRISAGAGRDADDSECRQIVSDQPDLVPHSDVEGPRYTRADHHLERIFGGVSSTKYERGQDCALPTMTREGPGRCGAGSCPAIGELQSHRERLVGHGLGNAGKMGHAHR